LYRPPIVLLRRGLDEFLLVDVVIGYNRFVKFIVIEPVVVPIETVVLHVERMALLLEQVVSVIHFVYLTVFVK
jgi:hypothetical protein